MSKIESFYKDKETNTKIKRQIQIQMAIPYTIEETRPSDDLRRCNVIITHKCSQTMETLDEDIIHNIIETMYEFCSEEYGYNINITSFDDFCEKYWEINVITMEDFYIFHVYYFDLTMKCWKKWIIEDYKEQIYNSYLTYALNFK